MATKPPTNERIQAALTEVWDRSLPVILDRVAAIERANFELSKSTPDVAAIEVGRAEAHKLAGALGTFGLDRGSQLAREIESQLGSRRPLNELARLTAELRQLVESGRD